MTSSPTGGKKADKMPPASPIGMQMHSLGERMKKHKVDKVTHGALSTMHMAASGVPLNEESRIIKADGVTKTAGLLEKAYMRGVKYAEDTVSENNSTQNSASSNTDKTPEEQLIEVIRRGWPDPVEAAKEDMRGKLKPNPDTDENAHYHTYDIAMLKDKAKLTPYSPDTTI